MKYFKKHKVAYPFSYDGTSCLHVAVNRNQVAFVKFLLSKTEGASTSPSKLAKQHSLVSPHDREKEEKAELKLL